jgi:hypothetical protein
MCFPVYEIKNPSLLKALIIILICLPMALHSLGQEEIEKKTEPIVAEGKTLYKSEMASWYGTDLFLAKYTGQMKSGGYFSYPENKMEKCIFYSKGDSAKVLATISFDSTYNSSTADLDFTERQFTPAEKDLYILRSIASKTINSDTLFKVYKNTSLNLIPLISAGEKKVYVITGPKESGVIILGNDYLLTFDDANNLVTKRQLHANILEFEYGEKATGITKVSSSMHTHLPSTGDFITATDICTLMLYEKSAKWPQHIVLSPHYVCIWDCVNNTLLTLTKKAWDKIYSDQKK